MLYLNKNKALLTILNDQNMFEEYNQRAQLIIKYFRNELTEPERQLLDQWLEDPPFKEWFVGLEKEDWLETQFKGDFKPRSSEVVFSKLIDNIRKEE